MSQTRVHPVAAATLLAATALLGACTTDAGPGQGAPSSRTDPVPGPPITPHSEAPSPDAPTPAPPGAVTTAQLARAADVQGPRNGTWTEGETTSASPAKPLNACQRSKLEGTGATSVQTRRFDGPDGASASAVVMSYPSPDLADQAATTLGEWWTACPAALTAGGGSDARLSVPATKVPAGVLTEVRWTQQGRSLAEGQGVGVLGDRVVVVTLQGTAGDWGSGANHPVAKTLAKAVERARS